MKFCDTIIPSTERLDYAIYLASSPRNTYLDINSFKRHEIATKFGMDTYKTVREHAAKCFSENFTTWYDQMMKHYSEAANPEVAFFFESIDQLKNIHGMQLDYEIAAHVAEVCRSRISDMILDGEIEIYAVELTNDADEVLPELVTHYAGMTLHRLLQICTQIIVDEIVWQYHELHAKYDHNVRKFGEKHAKKEMSNIHCDKRYANILVSLGKLNSVTFRVMSSEGILTKKRRSLLDIVT